VDCFFGVLVVGDADGSSADFVTSVVPCGFWNGCVAVSKNFGYNKACVTIGLLRTGV